mgnify:CR=1 FL=1
MPTATPKKKFILFNRNCPIRERTGDGRSVGRCWHYVGDELRCPRHGNVESAVRKYEETGQLTDENDHPEPSRG